MGESFGGKKKNKIKKRRMKNFVKNYFKTDSLIEYKEEEAEVAALSIAHFWKKLQNKTIKQNQNNETSTWLNNRRN